MPTRLPPSASAARPPEAHDPPLMRSLTRGQDLNLLHVLRVLLETCHVSETARQIDSSQPAVSRMLERLRRSLGDPLLIKSASRMVCTPRAEELKPLLAQMAALLDQIYQVPSDYGLDRIQRNCVIGLNDSLQAVIGPDLLRRFRAAAPRASLRLVPLAHHNPRQAVLSGELDVMIGMTSVEESLLRRQTVLTCDYLCVVSADHPLQGSSVTVAALAQWPYLEASNTGILTGLTDEMFDRAGVTKRAIAAISSFLAVPEVIAGTEQVCILPAYLTQQFAKHTAVRCLAVATEVDPHSVSMYWHNAKHSDPFLASVRQMVLATGQRLSRR